MASQKTGTRYDAEMTVVNWLALAFLLVATVASVTVAVVRGLRLWRVLGSFSGQAETALDDVMRCRRGDRGAHRDTRYETRSASRRRSHAPPGVARELAVLRAAAGEASAALDRLRRVVPRK